LHYTEPGDLVLDPFCGSGMTGVAAMMCARPPLGVEIPSGAKLGARKAILNDLSPAACHIAYNYTHPVDVKALKAEFDRIMRELQPEFDWLYGTLCDRCGGPAAIQYTCAQDRLPHKGGRNKNVHLRDWRSLTSPGAQTVGLQPGCRPRASPDLSARCWCPAPAPRTCRRRCAARAPRGRSRSPR